MGKYMRKCRGAVGDEVAAMEVTQAVGVRTRSRAAAVAVAKRTRRPLPPSPLRAASAAVAAAASPAGGGQTGGSCYLKLRSRMLFMAPPPPSTSAPAKGAEAGLGAPLPAGLSRCSSTASSVDASSPAPHDRTLPCRSDAAGSDNVRQGSASGNDNSESGRDDHRERRETTPSSRQLPGESSDMESDLAGRRGSRSLPSALTASQLQAAAARARMPEAAEIEEFFAAAEEAEAKRFASKYNFDVARGVPLSAGRFEWSPAVTSS
ncbi:cyclin-dependent kinase inhibitor 1-like isoform X2 [Lolium rigidum]|uniref:cyclin-dependent kinase inhibitor 1-like isoform X2 n=1 Tax=Lolium rigidum TaxID=89674 RepID=UPI001F5C9EBC|nr:cyclin-dependent kinase inhibitor 1-like isoform X2 [Lolium rigidum]